MVSKSIESYKLTLILLLILVLILYFTISTHSQINVSNLTELSTDNIQFIDGALNYSTLTLNQKISQMFIVYDKNNEIETYKKMLIGGIHMGAKIRPSDYILEIKSYNENMSIPFFISVDMEGCLNPFENFKKFKSFREIETTKEAYELGLEQGTYISELGFDVNFAPVLDLDDEIWGCRSFIGNVSEKGVAYIQGLKEANIFAAAKHYPGNTLSDKDPHKDILLTNITPADITPFMDAINADVEFAMVSHQITTGTIDSNGEPSCACTSLISSLKENYDGLVITDDISMLGIRNYYDNEFDMVEDVVLAGNDVIIDFRGGSNNIASKINYLEKKVRDGYIEEARIDDSVKKILRQKGLDLVY